MKGNSQGGIIRVEKNRNFSVTNNAGAHDKRLSLGAKGVLWYALTRPDNWVLTVADVVNFCSDGEAAVKARMRELKACGYLKKERHSVNGNFEWRTTIFEVPQDADFSHDQINPPSGENQPMVKAEIERELPSGDLHPMLLHPMENRPIYKELNNKELKEKRLNAVEEERAREKTPPPPQAELANIRSDSPMMDAIFQICKRRPDVNNHRDNRELKALLCFAADLYTSERDAAAAMLQRFAFWDKPTPPHLSQISKEWHRMEGIAELREKHHEQLSRQPAANAYITPRQRIADEQRRVCRENGIEF